MSKDTKYLMKKAYCGTLQYRIVWMGQHEGWNLSVCTREKTGGACFLNKSFQYLCLTSQLREVYNLPRGMEVAL